MVPSASVTADQRRMEVGVEGLMGCRMCPLGGGITSSCPRLHLVPPAHHFHLKNRASTSCLKLSSLIFVLWRTFLQGVINVHVFIAIAVILHICDIKTWVVRHQDDLVEMLQFSVNVIPGMWAQQLTGVV